MATPDSSAADEIIAMERAALERWGRGDPGGFLEIMAPDVSYFDPFTERRLDGIDAMRHLYEQFRGKIHIDRFEVIEPRVQDLGEVAVLTFRFESHGSEGWMQWNTTEVYRATASGWRIIHTHWAFYQPRLADKVA
jgi:ketosteroid isomerase-like protein